jgi:hypothetical protein
MENPAAKDASIIRSRARARNVTISASAALGYNARFDFTIKVQNIMEAERINSLSALLADLTTREAELRRYL